MHVQNCTTKCSKKQLCFLWVHADPAKTMRDRRLDSHRQIGFIVAIGFVRYVGESTSIQLRVSPTRTMFLQDAIAGRKALVKKQSKFAFEYFAREFMSIQKPQLISKLDKLAAGKSNDTIQQIKQP